MATASLPKKTSARYVAARAIGEAAKRFPDMDAQSIDVEALDPREARLALAIHRTVLQRWLTIEYLLNGYLRKPLRTMEPLLQGVLLTAGAQLLFMDRLPAHAVVDEAVKLARGLVRDGAAGLVNAVLRRLSELTDAPVRGKAWVPARDRLPLEDGYVPLGADCLADPGKWADQVDANKLQGLEKNLSVATSHPVKLVRRWLVEYGAPKTVALAAHSVRTPPLVVAVEGGFAMTPPEQPAAAQATEPADGGALVDGGDDRVETGEDLDEGQKNKRDESGDAAVDETNASATAPAWQPHEQPGFILWEGSHAALMPFLRGNRARRVQDVTSAHALKATAALSPRVIVDYCAGRGTKTRQLTALHPTATVIATDTDDDRREVLAGAFLREERVRVVEVRDLPQAVERAGGQVDLLVLDVPCTNTGVLARRPEARYRFNEATLKSLVRLQQSIIEKSLPMVVAGGHVLYSTCSVDQAENQAQARWICERFGCELVAESAILPGGAGASYRDGGYSALLRVAAKAQ